MGDLHNRQPCVPSPRPVDYAPYQAHRCRRRNNCWLSVVLFVERGGCGVPGRTPSKFSGNIQGVAGSLPEQNGRESRLGASDPVILADRCRVFRSFRKEAEPLLCGKGCLEPLRAQRQTRGSGNRNRSSRGVRPDNRNQALFTWPGRVEEICRASVEASPIPSGSIRGAFQAVQFFSGC